MVNMVIDGYIGYTWLHR